MGRGRPEAGRSRRPTDDLDGVLAFLRASRELEPPPPMSPELRAEVYGTAAGRARGAVEERARRAAAVAEGSAGAVRATRPRAAGPVPVRAEAAPPALSPPARVRRSVRTARRAAVSLTVAAAVLVGVVLAANASRHGDEPSDVPAPAASPGEEPATTPPTTSAGSVGRAEGMTPLTTDPAVAPTTPAPPAPPSADAPPTGVDGAAATDASGADEAAAQETSAARLGGHVGHRADGDRRVAAGGPERRLDRHDRARRVGR